jgi:hypothetical protein
MPITAAGRGMGGGANTNQSQKVWLLLVSIHVLCSIATNVAFCQVYRVMKVHVSFYMVILRSSVSCVIKNGICSRKNWSSKNVQPVMGKMKFYHGKKIFAHWRHFLGSWARIFKLLRSPRINSKEPIPPAYVTWRAGTTTESYSVPSPHRLFKNSISGGPGRQSYSFSVPNPIDCLKIPALLFREGGREGGQGFRNCIFYP